MTYIDTSAEAVEGLARRIERHAEPMDSIKIKDVLDMSAHCGVAMLRALTAERDALRSQKIELQSALAETEALEIQHGAVIESLRAQLATAEAQAQTARADATPLSEATRVMQKRIGSTPFPEGLQAIADDAHVLIARQAFRITQLEKVAMRPTP